MTNEEVFKKVLDSSFKVHTNLGPGLLESSYEECLFFELKQQNLMVEKQKPMPLIYREVKLEIGYRLDKSNIIGRNTWCAFVKTLSEPLWLSFRRK